MNHPLHTACACLLMWATAACQEATTPDPPESDVSMQDARAADARLGTDTDTVSADAAPELDAEGPPGDGVGPEDVIRTPPQPEGPQHFTHGGLDRVYYLHIPSNLPSGAPLVMVMHGYTGTAEGIMDYSGFTQLADQHGFVACFPQGTLDGDGNTFWDVGYAFTTGLNVDDVGFLTDLTAQLQATWDLSAEHVFATGMSNGAEMSYMLACQAADTFKAIGAVAGTMFHSFADTCAPSRPVSVLEIHGSDDNVTWYEGDPNNWGGWGPYMGIDDVIAFWVDANGLDQADTTTLPDTAPEDGSQITFERYWSDATPHEVWLYRVEGGGHAWPGVWDNMDIDSGETVWSFFSQFIEPPEAP